MEFHGYHEVVLLLGLVLVCVTANTSQTRNPRGLFKYSFGSGYRKRLAVPSSNINRIPYRTVDYGLEPDYTLDPSEADDTIVKDVNGITKSHLGYPWYKSQERKIPSSDVMTDYFPLLKLLHRQRDETDRRLVGRPVYA